MKNKDFDDENLKNENEEEKNDHTNSDSEHEDIEFYEQEEVHDEDSVKFISEEDLTEEHEDLNEQTPEEKRERLCELLGHEFGVDELDKFSSISASIIGDRTQPIGLLSEHDFEHHALYLGHSSLRFHSKAIPYLIEALTNLYEINGRRHFEVAKDPKNAKKFADYTAKVFDSSIVSYFDLSDDIKKEVERIKEEFDEFAKKHNVDKTIFGPTGGVNPEIMDELIENFKKMPVEEKFEFLKKAKEIKDSLQKKGQELSQEMENDFLTELEKDTIKEKSKEKLAESMNEFEKLVRGAVSVEDKKEETVDEIYQRISVILEKHGDMAAKEELYRIPEEIREQVLDKLVENIEKNRK